MVYFTMLERSKYLSMIQTALGRSPIVALLGPRQCGKTTLARMVCQGQKATFFDLESQSDLRKLENPELMLGSLTGLVVIDEIQILPELFATLRVVVDKPENACRFLILGSASPFIIRSVSETLAGRVEFVDLAGFDLGEVSPKRSRQLFVRGGFPRSFLADNDEDSVTWREGFIRTFLERDIPQFGIRIPAPAIRRFWTMLAHYHGQIWNASELAQSLGLTDKTVRSYLDILTETYMIRQLQPWHENTGKRQVKSPKIYFRDTGILHNLLVLPDYLTIMGHPKAGAAWEGFALEQTLRMAGPGQAYFWATYNRAELDLLLFRNGKRYGLEFKFNEAPAVSRSMRIALEELALEKLLIVYPGEDAYPADEKIMVCPVGEVKELL